MANTKHAMTREGHLLWILAEECSEVAQRASKIARFGLYEVQPGQGVTNRGRIMNELCDLLAVIEMLQECGVLDHFLDRIAIETKKEKVEKFLRYSESQGLLREES